MKAGHLGISEERVRPPDATQHLITDTQLVLACLAEVESTVMPVLSEVEIKCEVLQPPPHTLIAVLTPTISTDRFLTGMRTHKQSSPSNSFYKIHINYIKCCTIFMTNK